MESSIKAISYGEELLETLKSGVKPALGCTEPVAVGLAIAKAYEVVKGQFIKANAKVSPNIYKNGMGVGIPGTKEIGLVFASALGITCGDASLGLEVFRPVNDLAIAQAEDLVSKNLVSVDLEGGRSIKKIKAEDETDKGIGTCIIRDSHTNIVHIGANGEVIYEKEANGSGKSNGNDYLANITLKDIRKFVETIPYSDIEFLLEGVKLNMDMARVGFEEKPGPAIGAALKKLMDEGVMQKDVINQARMVTSAACDARMAGINMPVMSSAGSGNHGITAIIPPAVMCDHLNCDDEKLARALAFSHLTTAYIKKFTGPLSPVCGCAVAAGIGASVSVTWLLGGNDKQIAGAVKNMVGTLTGMVCDGAKGGCAFKLSTAASEAIIQAQFAVANVFINDLDGIVSPEVEQTIKNLGQFSDEGMDSADREIIDIMLRNVQ